MVKPLPTPDILTKLVSHVTETMLGLKCELMGGPTLRDRLGPLSWRVASLPIAGSRPLLVALSSDEHGCRTLGAALYGCAAQDVSTAMMDDALSELVNMVGGQVRGAVANDQALGLPNVKQGFNSPESNVGTLISRCIVLRTGTIELVVRVIENRN